MGIDGVAFSLFLDIKLSPWTICEGYVPHGDDEDIEIPP